MRISTTSLPQKLLCLLLILASTPSFAQFSEDFETTGADRSFLQNNCWSFAAIAVRSQGAHSSTNGLYSGPSTNHSESSPHYTRMPRLSMTGSNFIAFDHKVNQNKVCQIDVYALDLSDTYTFIGSVSPTNTWSTDTIHFTFDGIAALELQFYTNPGTTPGGSHRMSVDNIFISSGSVYPCDNGEYPAFPVEWTSVDAVPAVNGIRINWETGAEDGHDYFTVERSTDGVMFEAVGQVKEADSRGRTNRYSFEDQGVALHTKYLYRIRQVDYDGRFSFSPLVELSLETFNDGQYDFYNLAGQQLFHGTPEEFLSRQPDVQIYIMRNEYESRKFVRIP